MANRKKKDESKGLEFHFDEVPEKEVPYQPPVYEEEENISIASKPIPDVQVKKAQTCKICGKVAKLKATNDYVCSLACGVALSKK